MVPRYTSTVRAARREIVGEAIRAHGGVAWTRDKERRSEMSRGLKKRDRSNNRRARASVAINSMLTTIISEGSNEAAGRRRNRVPSSSLSPLFSASSAAAFTYVIIVMMIMTTALGHGQWNTFATERWQRVVVTRGNAILFASPSFVLSTGLSLYSPLLKRV